MQMIWGQIIVAVAVFVLPLALYLKTLAPTYIPIDSAEFALCAHFWGICHPPGFPLYILAAKIFTQVFPVGSLIYKTNLLSAILGAATVLVIYQVLIKLHVQTKIAFLTSLILAVSAVFWEFSLAADVFTFATFLLSLTLFAVFAKKPFWAFLVLGLLTSHFYVSAVLFPLTLWYFWGFKVRAKAAAAAILAFGLGFFPQVLLYLRMQVDLPINWGHAQGFRGFFDFIRRKEFGSIFLLANPVLKFSFVNLIKHFGQYFGTLFVSLGFILPALSFLSTFWLFRDKRYLLLLFSFLATVSVQLLLLSTIDPTQEGSPFQISKFYLPSFVLAIILAGLALDSIVERIFGHESLLPAVVLGVLILIYLAAGLRVNNYSANYLSRNLVLDSLEQLPENSLAITVSHIFNFGARYEQEINGRYQSIKVLYFPNEKNRDSQYYYPDLFSGEINERFVREVEKTKNLGKAETYILSVIARNLDRPVFILQGTFEEGFFAYLRPYLAPRGLWWQVVPAPAETDIDALASLHMLDNLEGINIKAADIEQKQQRLDHLTYAVALHSSAIALAAKGKYDEALGALDKSLKINPAAKNLKNEIDLIAKTKTLESQLEDLSAAGNKEKLKELVNAYFTLGNFRSSVNTALLIATIDPADAYNFNNLAASLAFLGKKEEARIYYQKALAIDPNLDLAKKGLEALEK